MILSNSKSLLVVVSHLMVWVLNQLVLLLNQEAGLIEVVTIYVIIWSPSRFPLALKDCSDVSCKGWVRRAFKWHPGLEVLPLLMSLSTHELHKSSFILLAGCVIES